MHDSLRLFRPAVFFNLFDKGRQNKSEASETEKATLASIFRKEADRKHKIKPLETDLKQPSQPIDVKREYPAFKQDEVKEDASDKINNDLVEL